MNSTDKKDHIEMLSIAVALMGKGERNTYIFFKAHQKVTSGKHSVVSGARVHARH